MTFPGRWQTLLEHQDSEGAKLKVNSFPDGMALVSLEWEDFRLTADDAPPSRWVKSALVPLAKLREALGVKS